MKLLLSVVSDFCTRHHEITVNLIRKRKSDRGKGKLFTKDLKLKHIIKFVLKRRKNEQQKKQAE